MRQHETQPPRWLRWAQITWVAIVVAALLMYVAGSVLHFSQLRQVCTATAEQCAEFDQATTIGLAQLDALGISLEAYALFLVGFRVVFSLVPIALGLLIFARRRNEPISLLVSLFLITWPTAGEAMGLLATTYPAFQIPAEIIKLAATISLPLFFGTFPNGRMVPRLYWVVVAYFGVYFVLSTLGLISSDSPLGSFWSWTGWLSVLLGGVAAQIYRYRRVSNPTEQQQTRWVLFGMGAIPLFLVGAFAYMGITGDTTVGTTADPFLLRRFTFLAVSALAFQVVFLSIGLAILRYRLFDIDVIIRKTLLYTATTALLALVFFGSVILLQRGFEAVTGQQSQLAIVLSTLAIAALFNPLRRRIQGWIDRRFYRKKYIAQQVLAAFAITARDETDMNMLTKELARVVQETMEPARVRVWLRAQHAASKNRPLTTHKDYGHDAQR